MSGLADKSCVPCRGGIPPLTAAQIAPLAAQVDGWEVVRDHHLRKTFTFRDFARALAFVNRVGAVAEAEGHHPDLHLSWGRVVVEIWTHAIDGLTESDFVLAAKIDREYHPEPRPRRQVWRAVDPAHAYLLAGVLENEGIDVEVRGEELFAGEGGILPSEAGPTLWVLPADFERATTLLARYHETAADESPEEGA